MVNENNQLDTRLLSFNYPDDNRIKAREAGAIEVIVNAMNAHINNGDICENGCGALMSITYKNGKLGTTNQILFLIPFDYPADNKTITGQTGAIEAIVNAMNEHINNGDA